LETAATLTREIKPYDKVSSFRGANILLQGQQINGQTHREKKRTHRGEITEGDHRREIKEATRDADQRRSMDQSRETRTAPRYNVRGSEHIVKKRFL
jgi:hypothetical protein